VESPFVVICRYVTVIKNSVVAMPRINIGSGMAVDDVSSAKIRLAVRPRERALNVTAMGRGADNTKTVASHGDHTA
jgi:hypothetical protein